jgi:hypothetical protein
MTVTFSAFFTRPSYQHKAIKIDNEGGWVRQNTTVVGSYLLVR